MIYVNDELLPCNTKDQEQLLWQQLQKDVKSFAEAYNFLLFTDNHMCIYGCMTKNWLKASDGVASQTFIACDTPIETML